MRRTIFALVLCVSAWGQNQVDLPSQSKNVDFSNAPETRPVKTGTTLPTSCRVGDVYFKTDAVPGANLYGCTATNTWLQEIGAAITGTSFQAVIADGKVSNTSAVVTIPGAVYRGDNSITVVGSIGTAQANAGSLATGAQVWVEFDPVSKVRYLTSNAAVTQANLTLGNLTLGNATAGGFTAGRIPIATCLGGATADAWTSCTDVRTPFSDQDLAAGPGITIGPADSSGTRQISAAVPNPQVYRSLVNGTASCPSTTTTIASYQFPAAANVGVGDSFEVSVWFQKTGASTPAISVTVDGAASTTSSLVMSSALYSVQVRGLVLAPSSVVYSITAKTDAGLSPLNGASVSGSAISSTPLVEFRASGCSGTDTIQVLGAIVTLSKGANL